MHPAFVLGPIKFTFPKLSKWLKLERLSAVLSVIYVIFNEGCATTTGGSPTRTELCGDAIRLTRVWLELTPDEPEVAGLLELILVHDSRRESRLDTEGALVTLENQDRTA